LERIIFNLRLDIDPVKFNTKLIKICCARRSTFSRFEKQKLTSCGTSSKNLNR